jgi:integrase
MNMAVRKIQNTWWVDFWFNHLRYRKRSPENSRAGAQAYELVLRQKLARGKPLELNHSYGNQPNFAQFSRRWYDQYVKANNKPSEQYAKEKILRSSLVPFFGEMRLDQIKTERIEEFKAQQSATGVTKKTINNRLAILRKCLNDANEWLGIPVPKIKLLKADPPKTDYLTPGEQELLLEHADGHIRTMILLALRTGLRQGEIRGLQWTSIDWQNRIMTVRHTWYDYKHVLVSPKGNRERHIPFDAEMYELLYPDRKQSGFVFLSPYGEPYTCHRLIDELAKVCRKAHIRKIGWHALRHTFATSLTSRSVPLPIVQTLLGHSTITTTMRYAHIADSALRTAIEKLNPRAARINVGQ